MSYCFSSLIVVFDTVVVTCSQDHYGNGSRVGDGGRVMGVRGSHRDHGSVFAGVLRSGGIGWGYDSPNERLHRRFATSVNTKFRGGAPVYLQSTGPCVTMFRRVGGTSRRTCYGKRGYSPYDSGHSRSRCDRGGVIRGGVGDRANRERSRSSMQSPVHPRGVFRG